MDTRTKGWLLSLALSACCGLAGAGAQTPVVADDPRIAHPMTFFVTSVGMGDGGNLGGLAGADAHCQTLAAAVGRGEVTWHAYLSTQGFGAVNARDRIGKGPWYNSIGLLVGTDLANLHGDTLEQAQRGNMLGRFFSRTEKGEMLKGIGDNPNQHDVLTGSQPNGRAFPDSQDKTCHNWTSNKAGAAQIGHIDKQGANNSSWNSARERGCSQAEITVQGGGGLFYCFAA